MPFLFPTLALVAGFIILVITGDLLVRGATALARRAQLPPLLVGLTIVAMGTSAPELFVGVQAVLNDAPRLALGNVVGSNIANVFLVLGLPALIAPIAAGPMGMRRNAMFGILATALLIFFAVGLNVPVPAGISMERGAAPDVGAIDWRHGLALLAGLAAYLGYLAYRAKVRRGEPDPEIDELIDLDAMSGLPSTWPPIWLCIVGGVVGLPIGSALIVDGGVQVGELLNAPNAFIGLTAIAFGTSLPELAATTAAALRRHTELAIGNILGSNLFNILGVVGVSALFGALPVPETFVRYDFIVMGLAAVVLLLFTMLRRPINRLLGVGFILTYISYVGWLAHIDGLI